MEIIERELSDIIFHSALKVHKALGPGLLESAYQICLLYELKKNGVNAASEVPLPIIYEEVKLDCGYRMDIVVNKKVIIEAKSVEMMLPIHQAQIITYMKLYDASLGILINFNVELLKDGYKRFVL